MQGEGVQVRGTLPAQVSVTALAYPPEAVSVPLNTAGSSGPTVSDGLLTAKREVGIVGGAGLDRQRQILRPRGPARG